MPLVLIRSHHQPNHSEYQPQSPHLLNGNNKSAHLMDFRALGLAKCLGNFRGDYPSSGEVEKTGITPRESSGLKGWVPYSCICSREGTKEMKGHINEWSSYLDWPRNEDSSQMSLNSCPPHVRGSNAKYVFISKKKGREKEREEAGGMGREGGRGGGKGCPSSLLLFNTEMGVLSG